MIVRSSRYDVGMIETFEQARDAVKAEIALLVDRPLAVSDYGLEDRDGWLVLWALDNGVQPLPLAATFVDRLTGFVSITALAAEAERIQQMERVSV